MEIICPSCGTKYRIKDEKIRGKTVKITCRKCSATVYVRDPALGEPFVFLGRPTKSVPVKKPPVKKPKPKPAPQKERWYVLQKGKRSGPFTRDDLLKKLKNGEITPRTFMWKPGLPKWRRAERIDDLKDLLREFQQWVDSQEEEKTLITRIPLPSQEDSGIIPPPPPGQAAQDQSNISGISEVPENTGMADDSISSISSVKDIFGTARIPSVSEDAIHSATAKVRSQVEELEESDLHEIVESQEEKKFFTKVFEPPVLDQVETRQPIHQEMDPLEKIAAEPVTPRKDTLREFSVLTQIEQKSKKRNLIYLTAGLVVIALVVGITVFFAARAPKKETIKLPDTGDDSGFKYNTYAVAEKPKQPERVVPVISRGHAAVRKMPKATVARHRHVRTSRTHVSHWRKRKHTPSQKDLALAKEYGSLFLSSGHTEAPVKVEKKTVVSMPKISLTRKGMERFLQGRTKQLVICSKRKSYLMGQTVKVVLNFTVASSGKVTHVKLRQPEGLSDPALFNCIRQKVKGWLFPPDPTRKPLSFQTTLLL